MLSKLNKKKINCYSNFDSHNIKKGYFFHPKSTKDIKKIINLANNLNKKILCIGKSNNWFDTIINNNQIMISLIDYKKKIILNRKHMTINLFLMNFLNQKSWNSKYPTNNC